MAGLPAAREGLLREQYAKATLGHVISAIAAVPFVAVGTRHRVRPGDEAVGVRLAAFARARAEPAR